MIFDDKKKRMEDMEKEDEDMGEKGGKTTQEDADFDSDMSFEDTEDYEE